MPALKMKILVVDDFSTMRSMIKNELKLHGCENVDEAEDGVQALGKINKGGYDVLITDWHMPKMDGLELLKTIRKDRLLKNMPVLMISSEAEKDKIMSVLNAGVSSYLVKPFTAEVFKKKIDQLLDKLSLNT